MQDDQEIGEITEILSKWTKAQEESLDVVFPKLYDQLKQQARKVRRKIGRSNSDETLSPTSMVNELYFKLRRNPQLTFESREQFYAFCRISMQRMLHDYYFRKSAKKHEVAFDNESDHGKNSIENLIDLSAVKDSAFSTDSLELSIAFDEALTNLAGKHPQKVEIMIMKYWLDETEQDIADQLNISKSSVRRELAKAIPLIRHEIDYKMRSAVNKAADITQTTLRHDYLKKVAGGDNIFLAQMVVMLNELRTRKK